MCFIIIREIRWVNSSIYIFFKVFRHGIMILIKKQLYLLERAVKSYEVYCLNKGCFHGLTAMISMMKQATLFM